MSNSNVRRDFPARAPSGAVDLTASQGGRRIAPAAEGSIGPRLALLRGAFDPPHIAPLVAAGEAIRTLALDRVLLLVEKHPAPRRDAMGASAADRLAMVAACVAGTSGLEASSIEIDRAGEPNAAIVVDEVVAAANPACLFLLMGSDTAGQLRTWCGIDAVKARACLAVWPREGLPLRDLPGWQIRHLDVPRLQISGAALRARVAAGRPIDWLVPAPAVCIISELGLYRGSTSMPMTASQRS